MKINEIIREKRLLKGLTQEQIASRLGITPPAVNKWEKGISYPDITLLPALARMLDTDLNTLLSFQSELSGQEIYNFQNELYSAATGEGMEQAFQMAMDKIHKYPSCDRLVISTALMLEGMVSMYIECEDGNDFQEKIEKLYVRAAESKDTQVQYQAKSMLISKYLGRREFEEAEKLLSELPDEAGYDKKIHQANLFMAQEKWEKAAEVMEQKVLFDIGGVQSALYCLMEIALKDNRVSDAERIKDIAREMAGIFDLWEFGAYVADFQYFVTQKDSEKCFAVLEKMLPSMLREWKPADSPLYRHIPVKENGGNLVGKKMLQRILNEFEDPKQPEFEFLRQDPKAMKLITEFRNREIIGD